MPRTTPLSEQELFEWTSKLQEACDLETFNRVTSDTVTHSLRSRHGSCWHVATGAFEFAETEWGNALDGYDLADIYSNYMRLDVGALLPAEMRVSHIAQYYEAIPPMKRMYEEFWSKIGCDYQLGILLFESNIFAGVATAVQPLEDGDYTEYDLAAIQSLQPHIEDAFKRCAAATREKWFGPVLARAIEAHPSALFLVHGADAASHYANLSARRLMQNELGEEGQRLSMTLGSDYFGTVREAVLDPAKRTGMLESLQVIELGDWERQNLENVRLVITEPQQSEVLPDLTERQWQALRIAAGARKTADAADALGIATATLQTHLKDIYQRMGVGSLNEAVALVALSGQNQRRGCL